MESHKSAVLAKALHGKSWEKCSEAERQKARDLLTAVNAAAKERPEEEAAE